MKKTKTTRKAAQKMAKIIDGKKISASGLILGYFYQLNDLVEEYYEFLEVDTAEE